MKKALTDHSIRILSATWIIVILFSFAAHGQDAEKEPYRNFHVFDFAASTSQQKFSAALSWAHVNTVTKRVPNLKVGYGVRLSSFVGANLFYTTAPAKYTSPIQNLGTIFSETIETNIDTITTATSFTNSINVSVHIEYKVLRKLDVGFNIDVVGFSFGPEKQFNIISSSYDPGQSPVQSASPTRWNVLLTSDNDIGSLNSEFFVRYWVRPKVAIRTGLTFLFSEYRTEQELSFDNGRIVNDRYRHKAGMLLLGVSFKPF